MLFLRPIKKKVKLHICVDISQTNLVQSVQFSRSVMSDSLWPHELQHARLPCPSPTPGVHSNSRPSSPWCHPAISSSVIPFSSCPQSFPASESFPMSQFFAWGGQSTGISALASFLPKNTQDWSPLFICKWKKSYMLRYGMQCLHEGFHGSSTFAVTLINNLAALTLGSIKYVEVLI